MSDEKKMVSDKKARMAPHHDAPPGQEQDSHGNVIPLAQRTKDDQNLAEGTTKA